MGTATPAERVLSPLTAGGAERRDSVVRTLRIRGRANERARRVGWGRKEAEVEARNCDIMSRENQLPSSIISAPRLLGGDETGDNRARGVTRESRFLGDIAGSHDVASGYS